MGTFGGALEARKIDASGGRLTSTATGEIEVEDSTLVLKRIHVAYHLEVDADADRAAIDRAHEHHPAKCPVYRSIHPQIACSTSLEIVELG